MAKAKNGSFDWVKLLHFSNFEAASVCLMQHAPGSETWKDAVAVGMKLELRIHDLKICPKKFLDKGSAQPPFWVATIIKLQGYYALVRYEGMEGDSSKDFWIHLGLYDVHPIGANTHDGVLIPPKFLAKITSDWRNYIINALCGARTVPADYLTSLKTVAVSSKYRVGDQLEVVDKYKISQLREARVSKLFGQRMYLRYIPDMGYDGFFCHEDSSLIHLPGWAAHIGHNIQETSSRKKKCAPVPPSISSSMVTFCNEHVFTTGMKLEAVDPLSPGRICAASICKVLKFGHLMIKIESYEVDNTSTSSSETSESGDWFCYSIESPYIFECGFCEEHDISLIPPYGYQTESFKWEAYLRETGTKAASIPSKPLINHGFKEGMKLEMADLMTPIQIHMSTVIQRAGHLLRIRFDGWDEQWDQWMDAQSPDMYPVGWCALVKYPLQSAQNGAQQKRLRSTARRQRQNGKKVNH
ncbi:unnamed protein product [Orchesella dallaii]|uniref:Uncharacterized protein n=1 Tax=Orchesella dallaii TaxID=48710 RepID=A0ABP1PT06_9HEXA